MVAIEIEEMYKIVGCTPVNVIKDRGCWWTVGLFETDLGYFNEFNEAKQLAVYKFLLKVFNHTSLHRITRTQYTFNILEEIDKKFDIKFTAFGKFDVVLAKMVKLVYETLTNEQKSELKSILESS